jgi:hypothetical protein
MQNIAQDVLNAGVRPMYQWLVAGACEHPRSIVMDGDVTANPVACSVAGAPGPDRRGFLQDVAVIHLPEYRQYSPSNRVCTQRAGYALLPDDFHQSLLKFHQAFPPQRPTAQEVGQWLKREGFAQEVSR